MRTPAAVLERSEKVVLALTYLLYALLITAPIGLAINALRVRHYRDRLSGATAQDRADSALTATEHHLWMMRTLAVVGIMLMVSVGTAYTLFGFVVLAATAVWWTYRIGKGVFALAEGRHLPTAL
jgi:uncharacterized membrane protein